MKYDARDCYFNMDTGCVELLLRDGSKISIDCTGVEDALDVTMAQTRSAKWCGAFRALLPEGMLSQISLSSF